MKSVTVQFLLIRFIVLFYSQRLGIGGLLSADISLPVLSCLSAVYLLPFNRIVPVTGLV